MNNEIILEIMRREGWDKYTNHPADRGGPTKFGVTLKAWSDYIGRPATEDDVKNLEAEDAYNFYEEEYVFKPGFHKINNPHVRELVIDCGVNHGVRHAAKWVQRSVFAKQDGVLGPISLAAVNATDPLEVFLEVLAYRIRLYGRLVAQDVTQAQFISGWNNRAAQFLEAAGYRLSEGLPAV
jgi:lysozyme family protein